MGSWVYMDSWVAGFTRIASLSFFIVLDSVLGVLWSGLVV